MELVDQGRHKLAVLRLLGVILRAGQDETFENLW